VSDEAFKPRTGATLHIADCGRYLFEIPTNRHLVSLFPNSSRVNPVLSPRWWPRLAAFEGLEDAANRKRGGGVFLSTFEKQLDLKRRIVVPQEFRAFAQTTTAQTTTGQTTTAQGLSLGAAAFDGVYCFPAFEADCLEAGGPALLGRYHQVMTELDYGDPLRLALETSVLGEMRPLGFDTAGRITLPEALCDMMGLTDWVSIVGLGDRFQIWSREAFQAHRSAQRAAARDGLSALRTQQRAAQSPGRGNAA
jgi:MraZ protein